MSTLSNRDYLLLRAYQAGITDSKELSIFMGQMEVESNRFNSMHENLNYRGQRLLSVFPGRNGIDTLEEANAIARGGPEEVANAIYGGQWGRSGPLGNTEPGDGWRFHGRGYVQLTGRYNYTRDGRQLNIDLLGNPDLAADREIAANIALHYWQSRVVAKSHQLDIREATHDINGGYNHLSERRAAAERWERALTPEAMAYLSRGEVALPAVPDQHNAMSDGVLKQGESGPEVRRLQEALNQHGAHLPLTGNFRDQTKAAVEGFQRDHGLEVDGKAGRDTLNALGIGLSAPIAPMAEPPAPQRATPVSTQAPDNALRLGDRGTEVLTLQASLIQLNINDRIKMPVEVNGVYGVETQRAVQAFQLWHGMDEVNGIADRATRDAVQQQASLAIAQRAIDQAQGQPVKDFATNASLGAQIDWRDAATLRDPNQSDSQPVPPPPAPAPARQVTARDYEALGWTPPYVSVASQSQEQSGHDHEQQEQQARQQQHREWQVQQDQRMQEQGRLKEEETGREEERSKEQQPALRPFSDPKHPEHELYADLKQRLEVQGHSFPEDRLHQIVGALHDEWFKPGWRGAVDVKNDSVYVRDNDRPWARSQTLLQEPAPSLQDTMQLVQQKDLEKAQQRSQSPDTPTQGPTR